MKLLGVSLAASSCLVCTAHSATALSNGGFESPNIPSGTISTSLTNVPGWSTTDSLGRIEVWDNALGVTAFEGSQFAEINAFENSALYQDVTIEISGLVDFGFAHRGRAGVDALRIDVTYAGIDGVFGTSDDLPVVDGDDFQYSTGNTGWSFYQENDVFTSVAGGLYRFSYQAVSTASGSPGAGNFIDAVNFGVDSIPEPSGVTLLGLVAVAAFVRRQR